MSRVTEYSLVVRVDEDTGVHHLVSFDKRIVPPSKSLRQVYGEHVDSSQAFVDIDKELLFGVPDSIPERQ